MQSADLTFADFEQRPHEVLAELRSTGPIVHVPALGGWLVVGREMAVQVMRDASTFTVDDPRFSTAQVVGPSMLSLDGEPHRRHRAPFADALRPAEVQRRWADAIAVDARHLVGDLEPRGHAELRTELAGPLAVAVAARTLGLEHLDPSTLVAWYGAIVAAVEAVSGGAPIPPDARSAVEELGAAVAAASTTEGSVLADAARSLLPDELTSNAAVMLFGAIETSEGATSNALAHLLTRHDRLDQVRRDRRLVESIVEESLRLEPAATRVDRYATSDVELAGVLVRRGDLVIVSLTAANRDPGAFTDPDELDLRRADPRSHLTFAQGPHACPGAQLARLETRAAIEAVLDLLADVHLTETPIVAGAVFRKPRAVQVAWTCGTTDGAQRTSNVCEPDQDRPASTTTGEPTTAASTQT